MVGAGRTEVARALFGADARRSGKILLRDTAVPPSSPKNAVKAGLALVPEDRKTQGLFLEQSIRSNITLSSLDKLTRFGVIQPGGGKPKRSRKRSVNCRSAWRRRDSRPSTSAAAISKKSFWRNGCKRRRRQLFSTNQLAASTSGPSSRFISGSGSLLSVAWPILMISSAISSEILGMSDRILVMQERRIVGELSREQASEERIIELATTGAAAETEPA